jgi:hypothetical protein
MMTVISSKVASVPPLMRRTRPATSAPLSTRERAAWAAVHKKIAAEMDAAFTWNVAKNREIQERRLQERQVQKKK